MASSITLNEAALLQLLESPDGPVGRDLERRAINVTTLLRNGATTILEQLNPEAVGYVVENGDDGLQAVIGIRPGDSSSRFAEYLAAKEGREGKPFSPALAEGLHI